MSVRWFLHRIVGLLRRWLFLTRQGAVEAIARIGVIRLQAEGFAESSGRVSGAIHFQKAPAECGVIVGIAGLEAKHGTENGESLLVGFLASERPGQVTTGHGRGRLKAERLPKGGRGILPPVHVLVLQSEMVLKHRVLRFEADSALQCLERIRRPTLPLQQNPKAKVGPDMVQVQQIRTHREGGVSRQQRLNRYRITILPAPALLAQ
jgi:hypothetical protein